MHFVVRQGLELGVLALTEFLEEQRAQLRRHAALHLQTHHLAESPLEHLFFDHCQQVFRFFGVRDFEVRVARDAKGVRAEHLHAGKQRAEMRADHLFERDKMMRPSLHRHPSRKRLRHLHPGEVVHAPVRIAQFHRERQGQVRDVRERVAGVDGERREHRIHLILEKRVHRRPLARREVAHREQPNPMPRERR